MSLWWPAATQSNSADQYLDGSPFDAAVYGALIIAGVFTLAARHKRLSPILQRHRLLIVFFAYCAVSILWAEYPFVSFKRWIKASGDVVMALVIVTDPAPASAVQKVLARVGFVIMPLSILLIKYFPDLGREYNRWSWAVMYRGATQTKNSLGMVCLVVALASLWRFVNISTAPVMKCRLRRLLAHGSVLSMALWLLWLANSITSVSCFFTAGAVTLVARLKCFRRRPALVHFLVLGLACICVSVLFLSAADSVLRTMGRDPTLTGRTEIWRIATALRGNALVGVGYESFWLGARLQRLWDTMPGIQEAHNGYLEVFLNLGWIGLILLALLMLAGYRSIVRAFRTDARWGCLGLAFFVSALIYNFTEAGFRLLSPTWFAFLLAILIPDVVRALRSGAIAAGGGSAFAAPRTEVPYETPGATLSRSL
ncbi:MAG: O-antigen ligase family protein [Acidobacteriia bacterium]|nr:O-antigen ligase family protein [Terriglobia bacterium]